MLTRLERTKKEGSEYFSWITPVTVAGAISGIEVGNQFPRARKYQPLDWLEVCNNDVVDITLIMNGKEFLPVPAGTIRPVSNHPVWEIAIRNDHAATSTTLNSITVSLRREPITIDDWARLGA